MQVSRPPSRSITVSIRYVAIEFQSSIAGEMNRRPSSSTWKSSTRTPFHPLLRDLSPEIVDGLDEALFEGDLRLPLEQRPRAGDVGLADAGVVGRQRPVDDLALRAGHRDDRLRD